MDRLEFKISKKTVKAAWIVLTSSIIICTLLIALKTYKETIYANFDLKTDLDIIPVISHSNGEFIPVAKENEHLIEGQVIGYYKEHGTKKIYILDSLIKKDLTPLNILKNLIAIRQDYILPVSKEVNEYIKALEDLKAYRNNLITTNKSYNAAKDSIDKAIYAQVAFTKDLLNFTNEISRTSDSLAMINSILKEEKIISEISHLKEKITGLELQTQKSLQLKKLEELNYIRQVNKRDSVTNHIAHKKHLSNIALNVKSTRRNLVNAIVSWQSQNLIKATENGILKYNISNYPSIFTQSSSIYVKESTIIAHIEPRQQQQLTGTLEISNKYLGRIKLRQKTLVYVDGFSPSDFGVLEGIIMGISPKIDSDKFIAYVHFNHGLKLSYGQELTQYPSLKGTARIVVNETTLLDRLIANLLFEWNF